MPESACLTDELVLGFVHGELGEGPAARIDEHLAGCPQCRALVAATAHLAFEADRPHGAADAPTVVPEPPPARSAPELPAGARVSRYVVGRVIGKGGMAVVYEAHDPSLDRSVALKLLRPHASRASRAGQPLLLQEGRSMARLAHPNVVAVYDAGAHEGQLFVAMQLVEGETLVEWLRTPRAWREVVDAFVEAGRGLAAAHEAGIVHGDFKPGNVLVGRDGRVRVTDFGLARPLTEADERVGEEAAGGTPLYMAPELFAGEASTAKSDQFSFCVALALALFGRHPFGPVPFGKEGMLPFAERLRTAAPELPPGDVPAHVVAALRRGLAVRPEDRFESMDALLAALFENSRARAKLANPTAFPLAGEASPKPRLDRRAAVALGAVGAAAAAGGYALLRGRRDAIRPPLIAFRPPWTSPFHVDPQWPHHLVNAEGEHLFLLNKTAWRFFAAKRPESVLERTRALGANVIRVALEGLMYEEVFGDSWPWGGTRARPDWTRFDERYWQEVVRRARMAGEHGIGLVVSLYTHLRPTAADIAPQRRYWEQALARLGAFANVLTWEIDSTLGGSEELQNATGQFFKHHDPYGRPISLSQDSRDGAAWPDKPWIDLAVAKTSTSSHRPYDLRGWYLATARNTRSYGKPAFNIESGREGRHGNDDGVHRRKQGWVWTAAGAFWSWHSWDGCEGLDDVTGYRAPGEQFLRPMADFWRSLPFWRLSPDHTSIVLDRPEIVLAALSTADKALLVAYLAGEQTGGKVPAASARLMLPPGAYDLDLITPATGALLERRRLAVGPTRLEHTLPAFQDDLLLRFTRKA